jgi:aryl-alcohol dehydrogenase-like predicted oxidoreductase
MKIRKIPGTDLTVSELCLGTLNFGDQLHKKEAFSILDSATKLYGINFVVIK